MVTGEQDFMQVIASPAAAHAEGLRFFRGEGIINRVVAEVAGDLRHRAIDYVLIGAVAMNHHGYHRFTVDIDIVVTPHGLERFRAVCVGRGYHLPDATSPKRFRVENGNVPLDLFTNDELPGDGLPKAVRFPDPATEYVVIDGVRTVPLPRLVELKLASGITRRGRLKDLGDAQELIRVLELPAEFVEQLDAPVRAKFAELYDDLHGE